MTRTSIYFYADDAKTILVAEFCSVEAHPMTHTAHMNPCPKHVENYRIEAISGSPFDCEVVGVLNVLGLEPYLGLSIHIKEFARWREQYPMIHFELVTA